MNPRIKSVVPLDQYRFALIFLDGTQGIYDCSNLLSFGIFSELQNVDYFKQVKVLDGTVSWPHGQDICPDTLFEDRKIKK